MRSANVIADDAASALALPYWIGGFGTWMAPTTLVGSKPGAECTDCSERLRPMTRPTMYVRSIRQVLAALMGERDRPATTPFPSS
jgi:DNA-directed RNA polymerase subunit RPC12/RpoP